jgi:hypothetical protein
MGDAATDLDALARLLAKGGRTRRSLVGALAVAGAAAPLVSGIAGKGKKKRCKRSRRCGRDCCSSGRCFAKKVDPADRSAIGFACCPAGKLCRSETPPYPDQCCYKDEHCDPTLPTQFGDEAQTICCRPCGTTCCLKQNEECIGDVCTSVNTARLPRTRR